MNKLVIGKDITSFGSFYRWDYYTLTDIYFEGTRTQWNKFSFGEPGLPGNPRIHYGGGGDDANWSFDAETGTLTISGEGEMYDYDDAHLRYAPWYDIRASIKSVKIGSDITRIGDYAFGYCTNLTDIYYEGTSAQWNAFPQAFGAYPSKCQIHTIDFCGEYAIWTFDTATGRLTISGEGDMEDYSDPHYMPWYDIRNSITSVVISAGITRIGDNAFDWCAVKDIYYEGTQAMWNALPKGENACPPKYRIHTNEDYNPEDVVTKYTVTWKNWDGTVLETDTQLSYGDTPAYNGSLPTKVEDAQYTYTFRGWNDGTKTYAADALPLVGGNTTYTTVFEKNAKHYTVTLPEHMEFVGDAAEQFEYGATVQFKVSSGYTASNVRYGETELLPDDNGVYTLTVEGNTEVKAELASARNIINASSITLGGELGLNFYLTIPDVLVNEGAKVVMNGPEGEKEVVLSTLTKDDKGRYKLTYKLKAIFADRDVSLKITSSTGDELPMYKESGDKFENNVLTYSIYDYVESSKNYPSLTDNDRKIINAMYTYAAYSAKWKYHTDVPAGTDELPEITQAQFEKYALKQSGSSEGIKLTGAALVLDSNTAFRLYFTSSEDVSEHTIKLGDTVLIPHETSTTGKYYVDIENIGAGNLKTDYTVSFDNSYSVTVSAMTYVYNYLKSGMNDAELYDLLKALYAYSEAVNPINES